MKERKKERKEAERKEEISIEKLPQHRNQETKHTNTTFTPLVSEGRQHFFDRKLTSQGLFRSPAGLTQETAV